MVAGIGCRAGVSGEQVLAAIEAAMEKLHAMQVTQHGTLVAIATPTSKANEPGIRAAAEVRGLPLLAIAQPDLEAADAATVTRSAHAMAAMNVHSVAEAAALAGAAALAQALGADATAALARGAPAADAIATPARGAQAADATAAPARGAQAAHATVAPARGAQAADAAAAPARGAQAADATAAPARGAQAADATAAPARGAQAADATAAMPNNTPTVSAATLTVGAPGIPTPRLLLPRIAVGPVTCALAFLTP